MTSQAYRWLLLAGILLSAAYWIRLSRRDPRLFLIYLAALFGAFIGGKVLYLVTEGWRDWGSPDRWHRLASGKTVVGALLGGFATVELAKKSLRYDQATGDWFAMVAPLAIALGRLGCWSAGCCLGQVCAPAWYTVNDRSGLARWPAVPLELAFNLLAVLLFAWFRTTGRWPQQHFHLYLMGYGLFRLGHEPLRDTPKLWGWISVYQIAALALIAVGAEGFRRRRLTQSRNCVETTHKEMHLNSS